MKRDQSNKSSEIKKLQSEINDLDMALNDLTRKNEWTVADLANTIRRLEEANYNLETGNNTNTRLLGVQTAECHNLNIALTESRNHCVRRENDYTGKIKTDEHNINIDRESMRSLQIANHDLTKGYDDMIKQKESQHNEIKDARSSILELERRIRDTHESFINRDVNQILALTDQHSNTRNEHMSNVRETIEQLRDNLHRVSSLEDMKTIEENLGFYKRSLEDGEREIKHRDNKISD